MTDMPKYLKEKCGNCGKRFGSHHGGHGDHKRGVPPYGYCPDPDETMDWDRGPGTTFKYTGEFIEDEQ